MYPDWVGPAVLGFLAFWLGVLSFLIWQERIFLKSLFPKSGERDIRKKLEEVFKETDNFRHDLDVLKDYLSKIEQSGLEHIQRVELFRYNPYDNTGGDQSFSLALLNSRGNGIVLTSLHARSGTRVFAKSVIEGKIDKHQFSTEEELVIKKALKK